MIIFYRVFVDVIVATRTLVQPVLTATHYIDISPMSSVSTARCIVPTAFSHITVQNTV